MSAGAERAEKRLLHATNGEHEVYAGMTEDGEATRDHSAGEGYGSVAARPIVDHPASIGYSSVDQRINGMQNTLEDHEIHFDERGTDVTSTYKSPLMYFATEEIAVYNPHDHAPNSGYSSDHKDVQVERVEDDEAPKDLSMCRMGHLGWSFRGKSPRFIRFGVLLLITLLPFGAHFVKNCFSSLETYFLNDPDLHFNGTKYGALMAANAFPNVFMPFVGGLFLDAKGHGKGIIIFLSIALAGHVFFTLMMGWGKFWFAMVGEAVNGLGSGTIMVAVRSVVSKFFLENELTFALGVTVAGACISKTLAKASAAPIAETRWGYMAALWYVAFWQLVSLGTGLVYVRLSRSAHTHLGMEMTGVGHADFNTKSLMMALKKSTVAFWVVAILHTLFLIAYHLFANFSGHFIVENYGVTPVLAGYISSLMPLVAVFGAPPAGLILDYWGCQLYVLAIANVITIVTYILLLREAASAVLCIVLLAMCESFVPTILLSALPLTVDQSVYGAAFGMAEVMQAATSLVANVFFGYSRDKTASYKADLAALVAMCIMCFLLTLFLIFWDWRYGNSMLNRARKDYGLATVAS